MQRIDTYEDPKKLRTQRITCNATGPTGVELNLVGATTRGHFESHILQTSKLAGRRYPPPPTLSHGEYVRKLCTTLHLSKASLVGRFGTWDAASLRPFNLGPLSYRTNDMTM